MGFKYGITLASFFKIESVESTLGTLAEVGFDAVEMYGEPEKVGTKALEELFSSYKVSVRGITGMWGRASEDGWKRRLLSTDTGVLSHTKRYVKQCIKLCHALGGSTLNICLFSDENMSTFDRTHRVIPQERKATLHNLVIPTLSELSKYAKEYRVSLLLEPLNRYSTQYCSTAEDAITIAKKVDQDNFAVMLDTFHMNIEENTFDEAITSSGKLLRHMHFAENNRKMPGEGHIDFSEIIRALKNIDYQEYISFEPTIYNAKSYKRTLSIGLGFIRELEERAGMQIANAAENNSEFNNHLRGELTPIFRQNEDV